MLHQRLAFASQLLRGPGRYYACYTVGRSTVHIRTLISVIRRTPFPKVASRTIFAPLRQRFLNSSSFKNNDDWPNDIIPLLMKKRDILVTQRQEKAVSDPVVAKEIAELDSLHKILLEWRETKKVCRTELFEVITNQIFSHLHTFQRCLSRTSSQMKGCEPLLKKR